MLSKISENVFILIYKDAGLISFQLPTASGLLPAGTANGSLNPCLKFQTGALRDSLLLVATSPISDDLVLG